MDGFLVWGLNPHGWGDQPSWCGKFFDGGLLRGNTFEGGALPVQKERPCTHTEESTR